MTGIVAVDRHAQALAALRAAEQRTGVRHPLQQAAPLRPASPTPPGVGAGAAPGADSAGHAVADGARRALPHPALPDPALPAPARQTLPQQGRRLPVHPRLAGLLPGGALPVGGTVAVQGSTSLLLALLATASADGAWVAFVGAPAVGMLAAADAGMALERVALVPDPGPDAPAVMAALLDGMDVVVAGPRAVLLDGDRRRLAARARERGAVLVPTTSWPGAHVSLDARGGGWWGVDQGAGWLRRRTLEVLRTGRGAAARPVELEVEVPLVAGAVLPEVALTGAEQTQEPRAGAAPHLQVVA
ncbi:hypothetical protein [Xylanimonas oleitrophica]|uniref:hypothetical protein n=1 Tax=Xylanimonas oleitrophica TaxID=2607479 RepID=UPI001FE8C263|nr:hypothetical protein [Xylanimonas oleitrophica]